MITYLGGHFDLVSENNEFKVNMGKFLIPSNCLMTLIEIVNFATYQEPRRIVCFTAVYCLYVILAFVVDTDVLKQRILDGQR